LLDAEVTPVLSVLLREGLSPSITTFNALHNHWLQITPEIKFLHGTALGNAVAIARALRTALQQSATPIGPSEPPGDTGLPNDQIAHIVGGTGMVSDSVLVIEPRLYYLHGFGTGAPLDLARAVRAALNHTNSKFES
jgi:hypothetical protein